MPNTLLGPDTVRLAETASAHLSRGQLDRADGVLSVLELAAPGHPAGLLLRGRWHYLHGRYDRALELLRQVGDAGHGALRRKAEAAVRLLSGHVRREVAGGRFIIAHPPGVDALLVPYAEAALAAAHEALGRELGLRPDGPVRVELLESAEDLAALSSLSEDEVRRTGTIALCHDHRILIVTPRSTVTGYGWLDSLAHEYVHYLLEANAPGQVPLWLHEGIARFAQGTWRGPAPDRLSPREASRLARGLRLGNLVPLERMAPSLAKLKDHDEAALAYAQVSSLVLHLHRKHGGAGLRALISGLAAGRALPDVLKGITGHALPELLTRWRQDLVTQRLRELPPDPTEGPRHRARAGTAEPSAPVEPDRSPWARQRRLGAILRARGRPAAAVVAYEKALAESQGSDGHVASHLARLHLRLGRPRDALRVVTLAQPFHEDHAALHLVAGQAHAGLGAAAAAVAELERANGIDPFDPEIHCRLETLYEQLGRAAEARREQEACARLKREGY
jgi:tetratricopeptide (TPR) repeat protein